MLAQLFVTILSFIYLKPYCIIYNLMMTVFNGKNYFRKTYAQHFMDHREYSKRDVIERHSKYKLVFYVATTFLSLLFTVVELVDMFRRNDYWKKLFGYGKRRKS